MGGETARRVLGALATHAPSVMRPALAECLHALVHAAPLETQREWLGAALCDAEVFGQNARLSLQDRQRIHELLCALLARKEKQRFKALAIDLARITANEANLDAIVAYELV